MAGHRQAVLLCAEDDDLDLVSLVHLGRMRGLELEVRPGVEHDDTPLLTALDDTPHALLVLIRSPHLSGARARKLKATFGIARTDEQDLLAVRFDPQRAGDCLGVIARRLEQLASGLELDAIESDISTARLAAVTVPINVQADRDAEIDLDIDIDESESRPAVTQARYTEFDVTARHSVAPMTETTPTRSHPAAPAPVEPATRPRRRTGGIVAGVLALGALGGVTAWGVTRLVHDDTSGTSTPAPQPEVQVIRAPEPVPAVVEEWAPADAPREVAPTPLADVIEVDPAQARTRRRARRKRHRRR